MLNYFQGSSTQPYHLSVGAVVMNDKEEICCHYFGKKVPGSKYGDCEDFYLLMRETIEPNESIEEALSRGLKEEFGMKAELKKYLGTLESYWMSGEDVKINKTTLYFLCKLESFDLKNRKENDPEIFSIVQWVPLKDLIVKMREQGKRFGEYSTLDESKILERII